MTVSDAVIASIKEQIYFEKISSDRRLELQVLIEYIESAIDRNQPVLLNFICTHNSRRSQFCQFWAAIASYHYGYDIGSYSGGIEVTACNERTIASLEKRGFNFSNTEGSVMTKSAEQAILSLTILVA